MLNHLLSHSPHDSNSNSERMWIIVREHVAEMIQVLPSVGHMSPLTRQREIDRPWRRNEALSHTYTHTWCRSSSQLSASFPCAMRSTQRASRWLEMQVKLISPAQRPSCMLCPSRQGTHLYEPGEFRHCWPGHCSVSKHSSMSDKGRM